MTTPYPTTALPTVVWHGDQQWGTESFRIGIKLYKRAKARQTRNVVEIPTRYGVVRLCPLSRKELRLLRVKIPG
jgi:hypothetical protein